MCWLVFSVILSPESGVRFPVSAVWKKQKLFLPHPRVKVSIVGSLRDREVACSASDRQGSNFESCVWRTVSSQSSHHPQEVLLAQFSLYVHKGGLKPDSFHFISDNNFFKLRFRILADILVLFTLASIKIYYYSYTPLLGLFLIICSMHIGPREFAR